MTDSGKHVAYYDLRENPSPVSRPNEGYHVVTANTHRYDLRDIARMTEASTTLTESDLIHAVGDLVTFLRSRLAESSTVKIDGLGSFSIKIKGPKISDPSLPVGREIEISGIRFTPDGKLLQALRSETTFHRTPHPRAFTPLPEDEALRRRVKAFFIDHRFMLTRDMEELAACGRTTACRLLARLTAEGVITRQGTARRPIYVEGKVK